MTIISIADLVRLQINDTEEFIKDDDLESIIVNFSSFSTTYLFSYLIPGKLYQCRGWFYNPSFTEESENEYTFNANGSIVVSEGTDTRDSIEVTACSVDYYGVVIECLQRLATHMAKIQPTSNEMGSFSPQTVRSELARDIANYQAKRFFYNRGYNV
jgi:hypothetical protein